MGKITERDVVYIAGLARLELTGEEVRNFCDQLGKILEYMDKLNSADTSGVKPYPEVASSGNVWRGDVNVPCGAAADIIALAPESEGGLFKVRKVLE